MIEKFQIDRQVGYQGEQELENKLIEYLTDIKQYGRVNIKNLDEMEDNLRDNINKLNEELAKDPLSDDEFNRVLVYLKGRSPYQSAKILRDKFLLTRDDESQLYINFIDFNNHSNNNFQVANQITVEGTHTNRYDVTILCNGFPIIQIELKRRGLALKKAFSQMCRYDRHSYNKGLFSYLQILVISNGVNTKYFSNRNKGFRFELTFFWTNRANNRKSSLFDFSEEFFDKTFVLDMLDKYMVLNDTENDLMVMRPYQIWATKALVKQALGTCNNAYVWHSTGSGKTLTSFKVSQVLAKEPEIKKVIFLVDRQDIDTQSVEEFNKFESGSVDSSTSTNILVKQLKDDNNTLIATTVQKLYRAVINDRYKDVMSKFKDEKVIIIVDECHRTQFGNMNTQIRRHFNKAQFFGFTGTPRFKQNPSADGRLTSDIFGKCIHSYLLKDAIADSNVLGFSVEYVKTFDGQYEEEQKEVYSIDTREVFENDERIELVANHIVQYFDTKTSYRRYNALFSTSSINMLLKYYDTFKTIDHDLKIGAIFSYQADMDLKENQEHHQDALLRIMEDHNAEFGTSFEISNYGAYKRDVTNKLKNKELDLVIVVQQLLTGFDSKITNTLFVDKNLQYHDLLQAFSRTNRIYEEQKKFGNVVCYRNLKKETDEAIMLFNNSDNTDIVLQKEYTEYVNAFREVLDKLYGVTPFPGDVDSLKSEEEKKEFVLIFRKLSQILLALRTFIDFEFEEGIIGISEQTYEDFKSKYFDIYEEVKKSKSSPEQVSILDNIDFGIELIQTDRINFDYIMNLIKNINLENEEQKKKDIAKINKELGRTDNPTLKKKSDLLREFLEKHIPTITDNKEVEDQYSKFEGKKRKEEIEEFAKENDIPDDLIKKVISEYEFTDVIDEAALSKKIKRGYIKTRNIVRSIVEFVVENVEKYQ